MAGALLRRNLLASPAPWLAQRSVQEVAARRAPAVVSSLSETPSRPPILVVRRRAVVPSLPAGTSFATLPTGSSGGASSSSNCSSGRALATLAAVDQQEGGAPPPTTRPPVAGDAVTAIRDGLRQHGRYRGQGPQGKAWKNLCLNIVQDGLLEQLGVEELKTLLHVLVEEADITIGSFWTEISRKAKEATFLNATLDDLIELSELYVEAGCFDEEVFEATLEQVSRSWAWAWMEPADFTRLLAAMSYAGSRSSKLRERKYNVTRLFNDARDRLIHDDYDPTGTRVVPGRLLHFKLEQLISILSSMARFTVKDVAVVQNIGTQRLHRAITNTMPYTQEVGAGEDPLQEEPLIGSQVATVCKAYGKLGYRHDTVFKTAAEQIIREELLLQRERSLGRRASFELKYSPADVANIMEAMLRLKYHRGNTSWCKWGDNYQELLAALTRCMQESVEHLAAQPLASASFVLGRARIANPELVHKMYARMMEHLEREDANELSLRDAPSSMLAKFLHGLSMMGPKPQKDLDVEWLMLWMCRNSHNLVLRDTILVNRHLVRLVGDGLLAVDSEEERQQLGADTKDQLEPLRDYLKVFVPIISERIDDLTKADVMEVSQTYNEAKLGDKDEQLGRHFFWALGRQFQKLRIKTAGGNRRSYRRIG